MRSTRTTLAVLACTAALALTGCGGDAEGDESGGGTEAPTRASEDPRATVYGFAQTMADGDVEAACAFRSSEVGGVDLAADTDAEHLSQCADDVAGEVESGIIEEPGSEFWVELSAVPMDEYEVKQLPESTVVTVPGDWSAYPTGDGAYTVFPVDNADEDPGLYLR